MILSDDQQMLREAAAGFLSEKAPVSALRALRDKGEDKGFDPDLWQEMAQMGWAGIIVPEDAGGAEFGLVGGGLIAMEMGRHLTASPFFSTAIVAASGVSAFGNDAQKSDLLPAIAAGELLMALAVDEGRKHAPAKTAMVAHRSGNGFSLSGAKTFVVDGAQADKLIVAARTGGDAGEQNGITLFIVDANAKGVSRTAKAMVDSRASAEIHFDAVDVEADAVLGRVDAGWEPLSHMLNAGRAILSAEMSGSAATAFAMALDYLAQRKQFGTNLSAFQALQHRAAHLHTEIAMAEAASFAALAALDARAEDAPRKTAVAKAKASQVSLLAAQEGLQMHGGMGMTDAFDIGFYLKRAKVAGELFGDASFHGEALARDLGF
ncbi:acyl-CoA dehydrogenase family protein [Pseudahrensia aquimaris]|uniref:Acyl-CoA dehydrogenase family protein n=1 Tax=Pseudahrensia aquimaris TaxID=744461 RepID=A0ABW3FFQ6_9HYPH